LQPEGLDEGGQVGPRRLADLSQAVIHRLVSAVYREAVIRSHPAMMQLLEEERLGDGTFEMEISDPPPRTT